MIRLLPFKSPVRGAQLNQREHPLHAYLDRGRLSPDTAINCNRSLHVKQEWSLNPLHIQYDWDEYMIDPKSWVMLIKSSEGAKSSSYY